MYRCANDLFKYCCDRPEWGEPPKELGAGLYPGGGSCKLDPRSCGKCQTLREQLGDRINQLTKREAAKSRRRKRT